MKGTPGTTSASYVASVCRERVRDEPFAQHNGGALHQRGYQQVAEPIGV